jgi:hypothetical protein
MATKIYCDFCGREVHLLGRDCLQPLSKYASFFPPDPDPWELTLHLQYKVVLDRPNAHFAGGPNATGKTPDICLSCINRVFTKEK